MIAVSDRSMYEVVMPDKPCKIHFDLEVVMCENSHFKSNIQDKVVEKFSNIVREELQVLGYQNNIINALKITDFVNSFLFVWPI